MREASTLPREDDRFVPTSQAALKWASLVEDEQWQRDKAWFARHIKHHFLTAEETYDAEQQAKTHRKEVQQLLEAQG